MHRAVYDEDISNEAVSVDQFPQESDEKRRQMAQKRAPPTTLVGDDQTTR